MIAENLFTVSELTNPPKCVGCGEKNNLRCKNTFFTKKMPNKMKNKRQYVSNNAKLYLCSNCISEAHKQAKKAFYKALLIFICTYLLSGITFYYLVQIPIIETAHHTSLTPNGNVIIFLQSWFPFWAMFFYFFVVMMSRRSPKLNLFKNLSFYFRPVLKYVYFEPDSYTQLAYFRLGNENLSFVFHKMDPIEYRNIDLDQNEKQFIYELENFIGRAVPELKKDTLAKDDFGFIIKDNHIIALSLPNLNISPFLTLINNLTNLTSLSLEYNNLSTWDQNFSNLVNLKELKLGHNNLSHFPEQITQLTSLTNLGLEFNLISNLPKSIGTLIHLEELDLSYNRLFDLPESIGNLIHLKKLNLANNIITTLPMTMLHLAKLTFLNLRLNPVWKKRNSTPWLYDWISFLKSKKCRF